MTTLELESRRQMIMEALAELDSAEALSKVQKYIRSLQRKKKELQAPCQYTVEEVHDRVNRTMDAIRNGRKGHSAEEVRKMIETWK